MSYVVSNDLSAQTFLTASLGVTSEGFFPSRVNFIFSSFFSFFKNHKYTTREMRESSTIPPISTVRMTWVMTKLLNMQT